MTEIDAHLPGRLSNPASSMETDPRADPRIVAAVQAFGGFAPGLEPLAVSASYRECLDYCSAFEELGAKDHPALMAAMPPFDDVEQTREVIQSSDGNELTLYMHRPKDRADSLPCIVHTHGGGMVLMTAKDPTYLRLRNSLARLGMLVIGVEFRNGGGQLGNHPFPAGLDDCAAAVQWSSENRAALGISKLLISGESGGGNLALATTLKAKREGWLDRIDGVFAMCPYIYGGYANPAAELLSLRENDGYMLDCAQMTSLVRVYDPTGEHATNPLAWPYHAELSDLEGLPPHVISVNELDPLRDEGLAYYRKLAAAGVPAVGRTVAGTPHGGDLIFPDITPEIYRSTLDAIHAFARSL
jgi:acetyl esterase/lipase